MQKDQWNLQVQERSYTLRHAEKKYERTATTFHTHVIPEDGSTISFEVLVLPTKGFQNSDRHNETLTAVRT